MRLNKKKIFILILVIISFIFLGALASYIFHDQGAEDTGQELEEELEDDIRPEAPEDLEDSEEEVDIFDEPPLEDDPETEEEF